MILGQFKLSLENFFKEQVLGGLPHPHPRSRVYRSEPNSWMIEDMPSEKLSALILEKAQKEQRPACVFDLDGTLFDVGYRTLGIIQEWLQSDFSRQFNETLLKKIENISYLHIGYSLSHVFENAGFDLRNQEVVRVFGALEKAWKKKFFDGKTLLKYDTLIENSNDFIKKLHSMGVEIFYLTGRNSHLMREGTLKQLQKYDFPIKEEKNILLKTNPFLEDALFKAQAIKIISKEYNIVGNFENEYLNLASMSLEVPEAIHVIVDSQHSGRPTPHLPLPVCRISHF